VPIAFVTAEVIRPRIGAEVVVFMPDLIGTGFSVGVRGGDELDATAITPIFAFKQGPADLVAPLLAARLDEDPVNSPCDEIVLAFKGSHAVNIVPTCRGDAANTLGVSHRALPDVSVPSDVAIGNVFTLDANLDRHMDLFILSDEGQL